MQALSNHELSELLRSEAPDLVGFLCMLTGSRTVAEDLFQETCLSAWSLKERFTRGTDFGAWVRTIARFQVLRHHRRQARLGGRDFPPEVLEDLQRAWEEPPRDDLLKRRAQALRKCLELLEQPQRDLLQKHYYLHWSHQRIASESRRTEGGVKMLLLRLRRKVRDCIENRVRREVHV